MSVPAVAPGSLFLAWCVVMAILPLRRPRSLAMLSSILGGAPNELPFLFLTVVAGTSVASWMGGEFEHTWPSVILGVLTSLGLLTIIGRSLLARRRIDRGMSDALGPSWRSVIEPALSERLRRNLPWLRIVLLPWPFLPRSVERIHDVPYGPHGAANLLDVYRHRSRPSPAPTLLYFHGGGFRRGRKSRESRSLLFHLAGQGWTCVSANYRLARTPAEGFPAHLVDAKRVIAWARENSGQHGIDPDAIFVAGSSAGAHLTAMAALTANAVQFQPGFEAADTSFAAGIGLGGYYGALGVEHPPSTPFAYIGPSAPPFLVVHGTYDTSTPVEAARLFADRLRQASTEPVAFAELPGAHHTFDLFRSIHFEAVTDGIEAFTAWVRTTSRCS